MTLLREPVRPRNEVDDVLAEALRLQATERLSGLPLPAATLRSVTAVAERRAEADILVMTIKDLAAQGLTASALAAVDAGFFAVPLDVAVHARLVESRIEVERAARMPLAAAADRRLLARLVGEPDQDEELPLLEDERFYTVDAWNFPDRFAGLAAAHGAAGLGDDPLRDPGLTRLLHHRGAVRRLYGSPVDFSFFVLDEDDTPLVRVECDTHHAVSPLRCREAPVLPVALVPDDDGRLDRAVPFAVGQLIRIASWAAVRGVQFDLDLATPMGRRLEAWCRGRPHAEVAMERAWVGLEKTEEALLASFSQNHRRSIRKGGAGLDIRRFASGDPAAQAHYSAMHARIGRVPALPSALLCELSERPDYVIYGAFLAGDGVGMLVSTRHGTAAYYSAGIMDGPPGLPVGHALMWRAIRDARADGMSRFDFGLLEVEEGRDPKLRGIARFKRGFCDRVEEHRIVTLPV